MRKDAPTISYAEFADAYLVTARRGADSPAQDQVAAVIGRSQAVLRRTSEWNTLGMRGTCSPGYIVEARFAAGQVLDSPFADISANVMVPLSHILWSAVWLGLATEALHRATQYLRDSITATSRSRVERRLAEAHGIVQGLNGHLYSAATASQGIIGGTQEASLPFTAKMNALKMRISEESVAVAQACLRVCGIQGYAETGRYSVARILRDLWSAPLMINNERLMEANSHLILAERYH